MKMSWTVLALLPFLLSVSLQAQEGQQASHPKKYMTHEQVQKHFQEPGHMPQSRKLHPMYVPLDQILPPAKRQKLDEKKKARKELKRKEKEAREDKTTQVPPHSLWDSLFPSAYAMGCRPVVQPTGTSTSAPSTVPSAEPSTVVTPLPTESPSATPRPTVTPSTSPSTAPFTVPGEVDLRACDTEIKEQFTPRCTAFATTAAMENSACNHISLAPDHLWSYYGVYSVDAAVPASTHLVTTAQYWPPNGNAQTGYMKYAKTHTLTYTELNDQDAAVVALQHNRRVIWGGTVPQDMASGRATIRYSTGATSGGHAIEVVGYHPDPTLEGGGYFILKNSWGTDNGDNGYNYYPLGLCDKPGFYCVFYSIDSVKVDP